jgi:uncharacterized protein YcbK (DUF882 family)
MRRRFLTGGAVALAALAMPRVAPANPLARRIMLRHQASGAKFNGIWHNGRTADRGAMAELSRVLADPGVGAARPFDAEAVGIAWELLNRTGFDTELDVHSGYRSPAVNRAANGAGDSQHLRAQALDIGVPAARMASVVETALRMARGGVGIYTQRGFIHVDSGPVRSWSDSGASGMAGMTPPSLLTARGQQLARGSQWLRRPGAPLRIDTRLPDTFR